MRVHTSPSGRDDPYPVEIDSYRPTVKTEENVFSSDLCASDPLAQG